MSPLPRSPPRNLSPEKLSIPDETLNIAGGAE